MDQHGRGPASDSAALQVAIVRRRAEELLADLRARMSPVQKPRPGRCGALGQGVVPALLASARVIQLRPPLVGIRTLAGMAQPAGEWFMARHAEDPAPDVRGAAALALAAHPMPAAASGAGAAGQRRGQRGRRAGCERPDEDRDARRCRICWRPFDMRATGAARFRSCEPWPRLRDPRAIRLMMRRQGQDSAVLQYWAQEGSRGLG